MSRKSVILKVSLACLAWGTVNFAAQHADARWDLTSTDRHALSPQTIQILQDLQQPVQIHGFFEGKSVRRSNFEHLMHSYMSHSDHIQATVHHPTLEPTIAKQYDVEDGRESIVLTTPLATHHIDVDADEEALTHAIVRLTSNKNHIICATDGHGEIEPDEDLNASSYSAALTKLEKLNYTLKRINLIRTGTVPTDCDVVLVVDPQLDWGTVEQDTLHQHILSGGRSLVLLNPAHAPKFAESLIRFGLVVGDDVLLERNPSMTLMGADEGYLVVGTRQIADHPIFHAIKGTLIFRLARTVQKASEAPVDFSIQELVHSSSDAWAETSLDETHSPAPDIGVDPMGPLSLAALSEHSSGGKILVIGDSDFTSNALLDQGNNFDVFPNAIAWLVGEIQQVGLRSNPTANATFTMTHQQGTWLWLFSTVLLPGVLITAGGATWLKRRKR